MINLAYLTSSSYSGSTLFTFLVNQHPKLATIGELEGWNYGIKEDYRCSCGMPLSECPYFSSISKAYEENNLIFSPRNFNTRFSLSTNERLDRYLTQNLGASSTSLLEKARDSLLWRTPYIANKLKTTANANRVFIDHSLKYANANVFMDATKSPFRLRHLKRSNFFHLKIIYMTRDLRGQVLSTMNKKPIDAKTATELWIRDQENISRVLKEFPGFYQLSYEDLCADVQETLNSVFDFMRLDRIEFSGNFRDGDHHILGNSMRVTNSSAIKPDFRWKENLTKQDLDTISNIAFDYVKSAPASPTSDLIRHYLG